MLSLIHIYNWEWGTYTPTFGLASVDPLTYERHLKQSGYFYGEIAKNGKLTHELISHYYHMKYNM